MDGVDKYKDLETKLPKLPKVLLNTIQSEFLEIKSVDRVCDKYSNACENIPKLKDAHYVVFSKFIKKSDHKYEKFIFLAKDGEELCDVSGRDLELYGLLAYAGMDLTPEYEGGLSHS